jgi:hypothetical protein
VQTKIESFGEKRQKIKINKYKFECRKDSVTTDSKQRLVGEGNPVGKMTGGKNGFNVV